MAAKSKTKTPPAVKAKIQRWLELRQIINKAEPEKKALQPFVKEALEKNPDRLVQIGTSTLTLSEFPRTYFNMEKAEAALGKEVLARFYEERQESRINVK